MSLTELQPEWSEPPAYNTGVSGRRRPKEEHVNLAKVLAEEPNRWAKVAESEEVAGASTFSSTIRSGRSAFSPPGHFDSVIRKQDDGSYGVWARYLGERGEYLSALRRTPRAELFEKCESVYGKTFAKKEAAIEFLLDEEWPVNE